MSLPDFTDSEHKIVAPQATGAVQKLAMTGSSVRSTELGRGSYEVVLTVAGNILQGGSAVDATASDHYLPAGLPKLLVVTGSSDGFVAAIAASGSCYIQAL